jgi:biotin carboxyl carrier protein
LHLAESGLAARHPEPEARRRKTPSHGKEILSPLTGSFYRKPAPTSPPSRTRANVVAEGDVIGLVEVMKSFHEVKAQVAGPSRNFSRDEDAVMAGQPLASLD